MADANLDVLFGFFSKLGVPSFSFQNVDFMAPGANIRKHVNTLSVIDGKVWAKLAETQARHAMDEIRRLDSANQEFRCGREGAGMLLSTGRQERLENLLNRPARGSFSRWPGG